MRPLLLAAGALALAVAAFPAASGHGPFLDLTNGCVSNWHGPQFPPPPAPVVTGTLSYLGAGCVGTVAFGSHAPPCPLPTAPTPWPGSYCGPLTAAGASVVCSIDPISLGSGTLPILVVGWDLPPFDGRVNVATAEVVEAMQLGGGGWSAFANPYPVTARPIAYPTNAGSSALDTTDQYALACL